MKLAQELQRRSEAFIEGRTSIKGLYRWMVRRADDLSDSDDPFVDDVASQVWILISEVYTTRQTETDARRVLRRLLDTVRLTKEIEVTRGTVVTAASPLGQNLRPQQVFLTRAANAVYGAFAVPLSDRPGPVTRARAGRIQRVPVAV